MSANTVRSIERALKILLSFREDEPELTLSQLGRRVNLSPATMHRLIGTLQAHGFLIQNEDKGTYKLGPVLMRLGSLAQKGIDLVTVSEAHLRELVKKTNETGYLFTLDAGQAICLIRIEGLYPVKVLAVNTGERISLNCGASPRILLASLPDEEIARLIKDKKIDRMTPYSLIRSNEIWEDVRQSRKHEYKLCFDDVIEGVAAIGAPIKNDNGEIVGALSIAGIKPRFSESKQAKLINAVKIAANKISASLGWG